MTLPSLPAPVSAVAVKAPDVLVCCLALLRYNPQCQYQRPRQCIVNYDGKICMTHAGLQRVLCMVVHRKTGPYCDKPVMLWVLFHVWQ